MSSGGFSQDNWRAYQEILRRRARRRKLWSRAPLLILLSTCIVIVVMLLIRGGKRISVHTSEASYAPSGPEKKPQPKKEEGFQDLWPLISQRIDHPDKPQDHFSVQRKNTSLTVRTTLNPGLQNYIYRILRSSKTEKSAVVVMDPGDGRILAMASLGKSGEEEENLCLKADFPAASLFKIISAAAAFEKAGYTPNKYVGFQGRAHTLYRRQLTKKTNRYTTRVKFRQAFAQSINPVFGKLGIFNLGRSVVVDYAKRFFFNQPIPLHLPLSPSIVDVPEDAYGLAEITSAVANKGVVMKPWVIREIKGGTDPYYQARVSVLGTPIKPNTAQKLQVLMEDTVRYGTSRKSFRRMRRKRRFRCINIGAKTGTINDPADRYKFDWITAYAMPKDGSSGISLAVLEVHGKILGTRSREIARAIIDYAVRSRS